MKKTLAFSTLGVSLLLSSLCASTYTDNANTLTNSIQKTTSMTAAQILPTTTSTTSSGTNANTSVSTVATETKSAQATMQTMSSNRILVGSGAPQSVKVTVKMPEANIAPTPTPTPPAPVVTSRCSWGTCYADAISKSDKIAKNIDNETIVYDGTYWHKQSDRNQLLGKNGYVDRKHIAGVTRSGILYDNCEGGARTYSSAFSYCQSKGMYVPAKTEARAWTTSGVESCGAKLTWTTTPSNNRNFWVWKGTYTEYNALYYNSNPVRCIR